MYKLNCNFLPFSSNRNDTDQSYQKKDETLIKAQIEQSTTRLQLRKTKCKQTDS